MKGLLTGPAGAKAAAEPARARTAAARATMACFSMTSDSVRKGVTFDLEIQDGFVDSCSSGHGDPRTWAKKNLCGTVEARENAVFLPRGEERA